VTPDSHSALSWSPPAATSPTGHISVSSVVYYTAISAETLSPWQATLANSERIHGPEDPTTKAIRAIFHHARESQH
jgi:hypothetical protein